MKHLAIAPDIDFPIDVATQKLSWLGKSGSGKTYAAMKLAELMLAAGIQIVALDPVGPWHGLRVAGKGPGFNIPVFGGLKGDIPLDPGAGALVADIICDRGISAVLDVSQMTHTEQLGFANAFGTRLFNRKKAEPSAIHLFIEECQEFIPQNPGHGLAPQCLSTYERIIKIGRNFGIGDSLISQRPQEVNKKALNQTECLFAFQMTGPQERKAMVAWMGVLGDKGTAEDITNSLPKLLDNHCIVWSPSWLRIKLTTRVNEKQTADVSSTPKVGAKSKAAERLTPIDLEALRETMAATIETARANDPVELKKEIAALKKQLASHQPAKVERIDVPRPVPFVPDEILTIIGGACAQVDEIMSSAHRAIRDIKKTLDPVAHKEIKDYGVSSDALNKRMAAAGKSGLPDYKTSETSKAPKSAAPPRGNGERDPALGNSGLSRMLTVLAQRNGLTNRQLGLRAGVSSKGGSYRTYLSKARTNGWIRDDGDRRFITDEGIRALGPFDPLPEGRGLLDYWIGELGTSGASRMLASLAAHYPKSLTHEDLGAETNMEAGGGSFRTYLSKLRGLELVQDVPPKQLRASEEFFS